MIIDNLYNASTYYTLSNNLTRGLIFLQETDLKSLDEGRHEIQGDDCFAIVSEYDTIPAEEGKWEAHRRYIDIQYLVDGTEKIGYANINSLNATQDYSEENDFILLEGNGDLFTVPAGTFVVLYPQDAHMPCIQANGEQHVRKVVVKVRV